MVDRSLVRRLSERFPTTSWAIWSSEFPDDGCLEEEPSAVSEFIVEHHHRLTTDVVFLGLNRADNLPAPLSNFHSPSGRHNDRYLKQFIQDAGLERLLGGYMTDLVDEVDPDSARITVTEEDGDRLFEQLDLLHSERYTVICFGNKPFEGLTDYLDATVTQDEDNLLFAEVDTGVGTLDIYRAWFYGPWTGKLDELERQLVYLDESFE